MSLSGAQNKGLKSVLERQIPFSKNVKGCGAQVKNKFTLQIDSDYIIFYKGLMKKKNS